MAQGTAGPGVDTVDGTITRHGSGLRAVLAALASQVHPVFMLPPLAASWFGAILAVDFAVLPGAVHAVAIFASVYTAHLKDGYVDFHVRGEDDDHPLTVAGCRGALVATGAVFLVATASLWSLAGPLAVVVTLPTWAIGYLHAPHLDTNPVTTTTGYPVGIALAVLGGFAVQTGTLAAVPVGFAVVFLFVLTGVKVIDDAKDYEYDRSIRKHTVAVVLGHRRSRSFAYGLMGVGGMAVLWLTVDGVFPPSSPVAVLVFGAVALLSRRADPEVATMLLVRGAYLFLAALVVAVRFRPLAGAFLPDIGVLGPYTYLATEVAFGAVAFALLWRAGRGALVRAGRTVLAVYPLAYVWDWYTLEVGVFAIPLRTGVELFGIPVEEHLFMFVVPALVLAFYETLHPRSVPRTDSGVGTDGEG